MAIENANNMMEEREYQAARFAARLYSGYMSADDEGELKGWLAESPENRAEYQSVLGAWYCSGELEDRLDELVDDKPRHYWPKLAMAASILLVLSVVLVTFLNNGAVQNAPAITSYATTTGEQKTVELPDGSVVTLNTDSRILVDYSDSKRRTILDRGEAFFDVSHDPARPFTVDTGERSVTVLGTRFDVLKSGFELEVAVVEGVVVVHRPQDSVSPTTPAVELAGDRELSSVEIADQYRLLAGAMARFSGNLGESTSSVEASVIKDPDKYPSWRFGLIRFDDQPLYEVISEINRYSRTKVLIEDSRILEIMVSGVFKVNEIEDSLESLEIALPLQITRYPDRIVIVGRNNSH